MKDRVVAKIGRDKEGNWLVSFPDIEGAHTYGRSLSELRRRIPEVLRLWDRDPARTNVVEILELPRRLKDAIDRTVRRRHDLDVQSREVQRDLQNTIGRLQSQLGLGVRDSGELLGISPQYAHKLRRASRRAKGIPRPASSGRRRTRAS